MRALWLILAFINLSGCGKSGPPLIAYRNPTDALASAVPLVQLLNIYPCAFVDKSKGFTVIVGTPIDECYKMHPTQHFRGVWLDEFEGSSFYANAASVAAVKAAYRRSWGTDNDQDIEAIYWNQRTGAMLPPGDRRKSRMVALDFVGRRTAYTGNYGRWGAFKSAVIVDRVISAHVIHQAKSAYLANEMGLKY